MGGDHLQLPQDPILLMSLVNTYLRDQYSSLDALCEDRELDVNALCSKLEAVGFTYQPEQNQFR